MGKASRKKHLKRQQTANLEKYGGIKLSEALIELCEPYDYDDLSLAEYKKTYDHGGIGLEYCEST